MLTQRYWAGAVTRLSTTAIADVRAQLFRVPLRETMTDSMHGAHTHFELITVTLRLTDGSEGTG
jgi:hypothetical protein